MCHKNTTKKELLTFIQRVVLRNKRASLNCLVRPDLMSYELNKYFVEEMQNLTRTSAHQLEFLLVVVAPEGTRQCEITKSYPKVDSQPILQAMRNSPQSVNSWVRHAFIVQSERSGNGKTLHAEQVVGRMGCERSYRVPILTNECNRDDIVRCFIECTTTQEYSSSSGKCGYVIDFSPTVTRGVVELIFQVCFISKTSNQKGYKPSHLFSSCYGFENWRIHGVECSGLGRKMSLVLRVCFSMMPSGGPSHRIYFGRSLGIASTPVTLPQDPSSTLVLIF